MNHVKMVFLLSPEVGKEPIIVLSRKKILVVRKILNNKKTNISFLVIFHRFVWQKDRIYHLLPSFIVFIALYILFVNSFIVFKKVWSKLTKNVKNKPLIFKNEQNLSLFIVYFIIFILLKKIHMLYLIIFLLFYLLLSWNLSILYLFSLFPFYVTNS
jgi:hypothetical protein